MILGSRLITERDTLHGLAYPLSAGLLEAAPDAMVCVDGAGQIVLVNAQAERLFGYGRQELAGQPVEMLVPDAAKAAHPARRAGYVKNPRARPMGAGLELSGRRRDGSTFPAEISLSAIDTDKGILVTAAVRDVTDRREAVIAARLASIIESSHDAVISQGLDGLVTTWNPAAEQLSGYPAAEIIGRHIDILMPAGRPAEVRKILDAIAGGERIEQYQATLVRKDGTAVAVSVALSPVADSTGTIVGTSAVMRDLTVQQRADNRFRGLLEATPDAMVCVDRDGRIVLVNAQAERLFGYGRQELAGQPVERCWCLTRPRRNTGRCGPVMSKIRGPARWTPGSSCRAAAVTAVPSRPRSPCPPSTPTWESW